MLVVNELSGQQLQYNWLPVRLDAISHDTRAMFLTLHKLLGMPCHTAQGHALV